MSRAALKQILGRQAGVRALVATVADALGTAVVIEDADGRRLLGDPPLVAASQDQDAPAAPLVRFPIGNGGAPVGWVSGSVGAGAVAALLAHLVSQEGERKALGAEVLHLYREINLIYSFSEKLAALLDVERVAHLALQEARHLIVATDGVLLLLDEGATRLVPVARFGDEFASIDSFSANDGIVGAIATSGIGEIVNDLALEPRRVMLDTPLRALIAAPLKVGERVIGLTALGSTMPMSYTAAALKLLTTLALQAATAIENARLFERTLQAARERERLMALHKETEIARAKLESEFELAARIQADLFPAVMPHVPGYDIAAGNRPARRCGGDYYDALRPEGDGAEDRLLLCVADVAGKGLPAALVMSNMQATLRALINRTESLPALAEQASALLFASTPPERYVTAALAELTPANGAITFVGAGHLDNILLRASGEVVTLKSTGTPLGLLAASIPFEQTTHRLEAGDTLVLFSDGVTDAQRDEGVEFGEGRLLEVLRTSSGAAASDIITRVFEAIDGFVNGAPQFDDITLLVARRLRM